MKRKCRQQSYQKVALAALIVVALSLIIPADLTWGARLFQTLPTPGPSPTKSGPTATQGVAKPTNTNPPRATRTPTRLGVTSTLSTGGQSLTVTPGALLPTSSSLITAQSYPGPGSYPYPGQGQGEDTSASQEAGVYPSPGDETEVAASPNPIQVEATSNLFIPVAESESQDRSQGRSGVLLIVAGVLVVLAGLIWFVLGRRSRSMDEK